MRQKEMIKSNKENDIRCKVQYIPCQLQLNISKVINTKILYFRCSFLVIAIFVVFAIGWLPFVMDYVKLYKYATFDPNMLCGSRVMNIFTD